METALLAPILGAIAGGVMNKFVGGKGGGGDTAAPPAPQAPTAAPAAPQAPAVAGFRDANAALASTIGPSSTSLNGVGGVAPSLLNLGKNTLLGA